MEKENYGNVGQLTPAYVNGQDPGSTYKVIVRTTEGYVAIRRLSKHLWRVRGERFDAQPLVSINNPHSIAALINAGYNISSNGSRVSTTRANKYEALACCGSLTGLVLGKEFNHIDMIPVGNDPAALEHDKKIEAKLNKNAPVVATSEVPPALIPEAPDTDELKN